MQFVITYHSHEREGKVFLIIILRKLFFTYIAVEESFDFT